MKHEKLDIETIRALAVEVETQPNAGSSDPYYTVQREVKDYGIGPDYGADGHEWILDGEQVDLEELDDDERGRANKVHYRKRWEHVHAFLTVSAARDFMTRQAHNFAPMRLWVESAHNNYQMRQLRALPAYVVELHEASASTARQLIRELRGVRTMCGTCHGTGRITYSIGSTWRGGAGGAACTMDVCNRCWGSGDATNPGVDLVALTKRANRAEAQLAKAMKKLAKAGIE